MKTSHLPSCLQITRTVRGIQKYVKFEPRGNVTYCNFLTAIFRGTCTFRSSKPEVLVNLGMSDQDSIVLVLLSWYNNPKISLTEIHVSHTCMTSGFDQ